MPASARVLELLALLQSRVSWSARELADRLEVSQRTLRREIVGLQELGYPIVASRGTGGGYSLVGGAALPPLVLTDDEAVAVVLGLSEVASGSGEVDVAPALAAMVKLVDVLPPKVKRRVQAVRSVTSVPVGPARPRADVTVICSVAAAARDGATVAIGYKAADGRVTAREVQPHDLVLHDGRLYLIAYDLLRHDWRLLRMDRISHVAETGRTFAHRALPGDDPVSFVATRLQAARAVYRVRATVETAAAHAQEVLGEHATVTPLDADVCEVVMEVDQLDWVAFGLAMLGVPFQVHEPEQARRYLQGWGERLLQATTDHA